MFVVYHNDLRKSADVSVFALKQRSKVNKRFNFNLNRVDILLYFFPIQLKYISLYFALSK